VITITFACARAIPDMLAFKDAAARQLLMSIDVSSRSCAEGAQHHLKSGALTLGSIKSL